MEEQHRSSRPLAVHGNSDSYVADLAAAKAISKLSLTACLLQILLLPRGVASLVNGHTPATYLLFDAALARKAARTVLRSCGAGPEA